MGTVQRHVAKKQSILVLDVKTVPSSLWKPATKEEFPPLPYHIPIVIGWLLYDMHDSTLKIVKHRTSKIEGKWEYRALKELKEAIEEHNVIKLVTFNGRKFDMPLLALRAMHHHLEWKWWAKNKRRYPFSGEQTPFHVDLYDQLSDYGAAPNISLQNLSELLNMGPALIKKSKPTQELWRAGKYKSVEKTCSRDLFRTWLLFLYFSKSSMGIDIESYLAVTQEFINEQTELARRKKRNV